ncbi:MAG TPA: hypothetical protein VHC01_13460 [Gaiellaceae bacterium]|jgi:hypothetical protein|nr:hypothetical protein [Gaiellaceae bacterium]
MRYVNGFFRFWWDFIVGDDWKIAAAVATVLVVAGAIVSGTDPAGTWPAVVLGAALVLAFLVSLTVDVRKG